MDTMGWRFFSLISTIGGVFIKLGQNDIKVFCPLTRLRLKCENCKFSEFYEHLVSLGKFQI